MAEADKLIRLIEGFRAPRAAARRRPQASEYDDSRH